MSCSRQSHLGLYSPHTHTQPDPNDLPESLRFGIAQGGMRTDWQPVLPTADSLTINDLAHSR